MVRVFSRTLREAKAWLDRPQVEGLGPLELLAREATQHVSEARRADWDKLLAGFRTDEDVARRRLRVAGLVRACRLLDREQRDREREAQPLSWEDPTERAVGLGPASSAKLSDRGVAFVGDLVWTLPIAWDDLRSPVTVAEAVERARSHEGGLLPPPRQCVRGIVKSATFVPMRGRRAVRVILADAQGKATLDAWWFYAAHGLLSVAQRGAACLVAGRVRAREGKRPSVAHPDLLRDQDESRRIRPRYPHLGVPPGTLRRAIGDAVTRASPLLDPVPCEVARREGMVDPQPLLRAVHGASSEPPPPHRSLEEPRRALAERLAWVEAFTRVWERLRAEAHWGGARAPVLPRNERAVTGLVEALGFALTGAQARAVEAVAHDLESPTPMRRLLLGDVGSGKTAVALAAAAQCIAAGFQCAFLVPTGMLSEQYVDAASPLVRASHARLARIAAGMRAAERREALSKIASGDAQLVVGTHALLEEDVTFARLGLVVVDEQQRLGVAQRLMLVRKGRGGEETATRPHLLSLSATPIPRTLALALRGELTTSVLDERPVGRLPVATELCGRAELRRVIDEIRSTCARGERVFFVAPRIEDDEGEEELGTTSRAEHLSQELAPMRVAVANGAMAPKEREQAMRAFRSGEAQVLVATTVVEVGIDVAEATLMVVDGAERFGLAQLHQLRGRVGRGPRPSRCLLLHDEPLPDLARKRLEALVSLVDGAEIARADLALRGGGDLGGTRQSGLAEDFVWLDPSNPPAWTDRIVADASAILARDPDLASPEHRALALAVRRFGLSISVREEAG